MQILSQTGSTELWNKNKTIESLGPGRYHCSYEDKPGNSIRTVDLVVSVVIFYSCPALRPVLCPVVDIYPERNMELYYKSVS